MRALLMVAAILGALASTPSAPVSISINSPVGAIPKTVRVRVNVPKDAHNRLLIFGYDNGYEARSSERQLDGEDSPGVFEETYAIRTPGPVVFAAVLTRDDGKSVLARVTACYSSGDGECD